jgi:hypothetical protein
MGHDLLQRLCVAEMLGWMYNMPSRFQRVAGAGNVAETLVLNCAQFITYGIQVLE